jgi:hypothetical protein
MPKESRKFDAVLSPIIGVALLFLFLAISSCSDQDGAFMPDQEADEWHSSQQAHFFSTLDAIEQGFAEAGRTDVYLQIAQELERALKDSDKLGVSLAPAAYLLGDVNEDGVVDLLDIVLIAEHFGSHEGEILYDPKYDLNSDGKIGILDL